MELLFCFLFQELLPKDGHIEFQGLQMQKIYCMIDCSHQMLTDNMDPEDEI